jgi:hypothetical protein
MGTLARIGTWLCRKHYSLSMPSTINRDRFSNSVYCESRTCPTDIIGYTEGGSRSVLHVVCAGVGLTRLPEVAQMQSH